MNTTKAYLAALGTTGILIGSAVLALVLGPGFVGFTGAPELDDAPYRLERVIVKEHRAGHEPLTAGARAPARSPRESATQR